MVHTVCSWHFEPVAVFTIFVKTLSHTTNKFRGSSEKVSDAIRHMLVAIFFFDSC